MQSLCRLRTAKDFHCSLPSRGGERGLALGAYGRQRRGNLICWQSFARKGLPRGKLCLNAKADRRATSVDLLRNGTQDLGQLDMLGF